MIKIMPMKPQTWYRVRNVCFVPLPAIVNITDCPVCPHVPTQWSITRLRFGRGTWAAQAPPPGSTCRSMAKTARQKCSSSPAAQKFLIARPRTHSRYVGKAMGVSTECQWMPQNVGIELDLIPGFLESPGKL